MKPVKLSGNAHTAVGQTGTGNCSYRDTTEPEVSGTVFRQRNRTTLQYFQVLRSGYRSLYSAGSDGLAGGLNLYQYAPNPLGLILGDLLVITFYMKVNFGML